MTAQHTEDEGWGAPLQCTRWYVIFLHGLLVVGEAALAANVDCPGSCPYDAIASSPANGC